MHQKLATDPFLILLNNPIILDNPVSENLIFKVSENLKNKVFWNRIIKKPEKKISSFFLSNSVPFNGQSYQKQKGSGTSH